MDRFLKFIKQPHPVRDEIVFGTGVIFFFIADRLLKYYAVHSRTDFFILPGVVKFALTPNKGIALGIPFPMSLTILMSVFLALILIVFFYQTHRTKKVFYRFSYVNAALALLIGGGISNGFDRVWYGYVVDYVRIISGVGTLHFNSADVMVVFGAAALFFVWGKGSHTQAEQILHATTKTYDAIASDFAKSREKPMWEEVKRVAAYCTPHSRILDCGCGSGRLLEILPSFPLTYYGIDASSSLIDIAKKKAESLRKKGVVLNAQMSFQKMDMRHLRFEDAAFDLVCMIASFHHIPPQFQKEVVAEAYRVLAPGGRVCMTVFNLWRVSHTGKTLWRYIGTMPGLKEVMTSWNNNPLYYYPI